MFYLPFLAFDSTKDLPLSCVLLAFIAGSLGISLTNGGLGSYPLLVGIVVAYFLTDLPKDEAFAIGNALGLIVWVSQTLLLIVLGLISWFLIPKKI
jgi:thiol:disulfide interchange protein